MTYATINKRFAEIVEAYLLGGWVIDTSTFRSLECGSGERCRVTLTDGQSNLYIRIVEKSDFPKYLLTISVDYADKDTLRKNGIRPNIYNANTLYSDRMTNLYSETYWKIGTYYNCNWFGTETEAANAEAVRRARRRLNSESDLIDLTQMHGAKEIALKYIRREYYRSYKLSDIERVEKRVYSHDGKTWTEYRIHAKGKTFGFQVRTSRGCYR